MASVQIKSLRCATQRSRCSGSHVGNRGVIKGTQHMHKGQRRRSTCTDAGTHSRGRLHADDPLYTALRCGSIAPSATFLCSSNSIHDTVQLTRHTSDYDCRNCCVALCRASWWLGNHRKLTALHVLKRACMVPSQTLVKTCQKLPNLLQHCCARHRGTSRTLRSLSTARLLAPNIVYAGKLIHR
jgi:hypothetical protein